MPAESLGPACLPAPAPRPLALHRLHKLPVPSLKPPLAPIPATGLICSSPSLCQNSLSEKGPVLRDDCHCDLLQEARREEQETKLIEYLPGVRQSCLLSSKS